MQYKCNFIIQSSSTGAWNFGNLGIQRSKHSSEIGHYRNVEMQEMNTSKIGSFQIAWKFGSIKIQKPKHYLVVWNYRNVEIREINTFGNLQLPEI